MEPGRSGREDVRPSATHPATISRPQWSPAVVAGKTLYPGVAILVAAPPQWSPAVVAGKTGGAGRPAPPRRCRNGARPWWPGRPPSARIHR
jgi:hypothetical protein